MDKAKQHNNKKNGLQQMKKLSLPSTVDQVNSLRTTALFNTTLLLIILSFLVSIAFDKQSEKVRHNLQWGGIFSNMKMLAKRLSPFI